MIVFRLTGEQAQSIQGQQYAPGLTFWWVFDGNNPPNKIITAEQVEQCTNPDFQWVKDLPEIEWVAPAPPIDDEA